MTRFSENAHWYALGAALTVTLTLLAILQYRSNRQLRDVLQTQMRTSLQRSLMNVRFGLEQELSPICNAIQGWGSDPQSSPETLAREIADWRRTAVHPALVSNVFVYMVDPGNIIPRFAQLEPKYNQFIEAEWPANFLALQAKLNEIADQAWTQEHSAPVPAWLIDEDVPALVYAAHSAQASAPEAFVIVELNTDELAHHILPELAQRYLGSNGHLDYQVALINQNIQRNVVYTSDSGFGSDRSAIDAQLNVFGPPMPNHGEPGRTMSHTAQAPEPGPEHREPPRHDFRLPPGTHPDEAGRREAPFRLQAIRYSPDDRGWTLIARHRKGSVEAAVASLYHRNLAVSFGVLLVLAGTIALVVMTAQRSRRLAQLKMDFVASVSHELRTPLTGIVMAAQNAADGLVETKDRAMLYGRAILGQAQQLSELIEQILLFSATEKGRHQFHFQWVDISEVIESALDGSASLIRSAQAQVQHTIQADLPPISSDYKALTQSVQNLLANAIKYGGEDRWVGLRAYRAGSTELGKEVVITVEDHGIGIAPDEVKKIFEPFYRSPAVTTAQIHGSGLGLSIVKSMVEAIGGKLTVESELGKGSSFSVHLPAEKQPGPLAHDSPSVEAADHR